MSGFKQCPICILMIKYIPNLHPFIMISWNFPFLSGTPECLNTKPTQIQKSYIAALGLGISVTALKLMQQNQRLIPVSSSTVSKHLSNVPRA